MLEGFNLLMKKDRNNFYELVSFKKSNFEILLNEISERLKNLVAECEVLGQLKFLNLADRTRILLKNELGVKDPMITINKLLIHILRLVNSDFIYYNVKVGGSMNNNPSDPGQPLLTALYKDLFYIELFRAIEAKQLNSVILLIKTLDHVA